MSLPSQNARIIGSRATVMSRRRRRRRGGGGLLRLMMVAIAALIAWWLWPSGGNDGPDPESKGTVQASGGNDAAIEHASAQRSGEPASRQQGRSHSDEPASGTLATNRSSPLREPSRVLPTPLVIDQGRGGSVSGSRDGSNGTITGSLPSQPTREAPREASQAENRQAGSGDTDFDSRRVGAIVDEAEREIARANPVAGRSLLSDALREPTSSITDRRLLRERLTELNEDLLFSPRVAPGDPIAFAYEIERGDVLSTLVRRQKLGVDWRLITHINQLARPERIRAGQRIKLVRGPFHAVVSKDAYRLDLYWGDPDLPAEWLFIRSFPVGLGEYDGTPLGEFVIRKDSRLVNPAWTNPRTGERFSANDPDNPIGEYWISLDGVGDAASHTGYGIHGTIEPDSIGADQSMGCIRMLDDDIKLLYGMLVGGDTRVIIQP